MTGSRVVLNLHALPSAFRPISNRRVRRHLWNRHMATAAAMVEHRPRAAVAVFGDFNAPPRKVRQLRRIGMRQLVRSATHGRDRFDHCWVIRDEGRAATVSMPSDHDAVVVTFRDGTTVAGWNMGDGPDERKAVGLDRLVHHGADVICLQEAGDRGQLLDRWCQLTGWRLWPGNGAPGAASVPILYNPRTVRVWALGTRPATPAQPIGPAGAGPDDAKAKVINRLRYEARR